MTIIAYHDGLLIADRRTLAKSTDCYSEIVTERQKIFTSTCGRYACGVTGRVQTPEQMEIIMPELVDHTLNFRPTIELSEACNKAINLNGFSSYIIITAAQVAVFTGAELQFIPSGSPVFAGSGDSLAKGHWLAGKTLRQSVEFAASLSGYCGSVFDTIDCKKLFKKDATMARARSKK